MIEIRRIPLLYVVSAPSGAGKTTLCTRMLKEFEEITYSVSCTTRKPRAGEVDGEDYHFMPQQEFERRRDAGEFIEHALVHGHYYGTLKASITEAMAAGHDVLMDIDVQGAAQIRQAVEEGDDTDPLKHNLIDIFIAPPSMDTLAKRLHGRGSDDEATIKRRLEEAEREVSRSGEYTYLVINDDLDMSYDTLRSIVVAERHRHRVNNAIAHG